MDLDSFPINPLISRSPNMLNVSRVSLKKKTRVVILNFGGFNFDIHFIPEFHVRGPV